MSNELREADEGRGDTGGIEPEDFGGRVRRFAIDARRVLGCPDSPIDDVLELHRRASSLLRGAPGAPSSEMHRWLLAMQAAIDDRLRSWPLEELESLVAWRRARRETARTVRQAD
jgi:hypothetical protein